MTPHPRPIQPIAAARALARLVRDPQDTPQVFTIINALRGRGTERRMQRFRATPDGRRLLTAPRPLLSYLNERDRLADLPPGTLGREYFEFLAAADLSADGLAEVSRHDDDARMSQDELYYYHRMRDSHDLLHVLTGYGRLPLGEVCVLAFSHPHHGGHGIAVICAVGTVKVSRDMPSVGVPGIVAEAYRRGRAARPLEGAEWETMLDQPLAELHERFGIRPAPRYEAAMARLALTRPP